MVIDCPDQDRMREFFGLAAGLEGQYEFIAKPRRMTLSQKQRGYYHGHVVEIFAEKLEDTGQELPRDEQDNLLFDNYHEYAHAILKRRCLRIPVRDGRGNVVDWLTGSTEQLNTLQMSEFTERARKYLWDRFRLTTMDPDPKWREAAERRHQRTSPETAAKPAA